MVIQSAALAAVHAQPSATATDALHCPPSAGIACDVGAIDASHDGLGGGGGGCAGARACAISSVRPATRSDPDRASPPFAATLTLTAPFPVPLEPAVTTIHSD